MPKAKKGSEVKDEAEDTKNDDNKREHEEDEEADSSNKRSRPDEEKKIAPTPQGPPHAGMVNPFMMGFPPPYPHMWGGMPPNMFPGMQQGGKKADGEDDDKDDLKDAKDDNAGNNYGFMPGMPPMMNPMMMGYGPPGFMNPFFRRPRPRQIGIPLAMSCDMEQLSDYQILVRQQLELFEAAPEDVESNTQGRKKPVLLAQVGLRCRHCAAFPLRARGRGAVYYPTKLFGVYQAAQNMAGSHLCRSCQHIPDQVRQELIALRARRDNASGGKQYWSDGCKALGVYEDENCLRMDRNNSTGGNQAAAAAAAPAVAAAASAASANAASV